MRKKLLKRAPASLPALLWLMLLALLPVQLSARDFTYTYEGKTINYTVLDEEAKTVETKNGTSFWAGNSVAGDLVIPVTVSDGTNEYTVTAIGDYSFSGCTSLTSVEIPNTVASLGEFAFHRCYSLTTIEIPNSVTSIEPEAFSYCTSLTKFTIADSDNEIAFGKDVLKKCSIDVLYIGRNWKFANNYESFSADVKTVALGDKVTALPDDAFSGCTSLTGIEIPGSVTSIGERAFLRCESLTSLEIPASVTSIGEEAFEYCSNLKKFTLADTDNEISFGSRALNSCPIEDLYIGRNWTYASKDYSISTGIKTVTLGNKVTVLPEGAFSRCTGLTSIEIPNSVTSIGEMAFYDCTGLTNAVIGNSVTSIGEYAFYKCSGLTSIEIPGSVTSVEKYAFYDCDQLKKITVADSNNEISFGPYALYGEDLYIGRNWTQYNYQPILKGIKTVTLGDKVTALPDNAFAHCTDLTSIEIPGSVTSIGYGAFSGCAGLANIEIPSSVTSIGYGAFSGCAGLANIEIPSSVTSIGYGAFSGCAGLVSIQIPGSVTSIEGSTFSGCISLTSIDIPASVTSIGYDAFSGCISLTSIDIPASVTSIGYDAFSGCSSLAQLNVAATTPPDVSSDAFDDEMYEKTRLNVPDDAMLSYVTHPVWRRFNNIAGQKIEADIFENGGFKYRVFAENSLMLLKGDYSALTEANLTKRVAYKGKFYYVRAIGVDAFEGCANLIKVALNDDVILIADNAFKGCSKLSDINWPSSLTLIGREAFSGCTGLTDAVIGNSVTSIRIGAFYGCTGLKTAVIGNSVTSIETQVFDGCRSLTSIEIPNSVTLIGIRAFYNCTGLKTTVIGNSVTSIGYGAFSGCAGLASIEIPNSVTSIGESAFEGCSSLKSIEIPNSVTSIGESAFAGCSRLASIELSGSVTSIEGYTFENCSALTSIEIPGSAISIGRYAFENCSRLASIEIPESVTSIREYAFSNCSSLKKFIIADADEEIVFGTLALSKSPIDSLYIGRNWSFEGDYLLIPNSVRTVTLGNKVTVLADYAFQYCSNLASITLPGSLSSLNLHWFYGCDALKSMSFDYGDTPLPIVGNLPQNVEKLCIDRELSSESFNAAPLKEVEFGNIVTVIPANMFKGCANLRTLTLGSSIQTIGESAFQNCALTGVTLSPGVTAVGANAFNDNPLASVSIGANVAEIGANAFGKAGVSIANVYITATNIPEAADNSFSDYNGQLWVMPGMAEEYYNSIPCFYMFEKGKDMVEPDNVTIAHEAPAEGLKPGDTVQLTATVAPANVTLGHVFWSSTNPAIATVDNNGLVKFHGDNAARAYAAGDDAECKIIATTLYADGPIAEVSISGKGVTSGIDDVFGDSDAEIERPNDIYTLQGVCLKRNASQADIDALTPGIYIIAGKKVLVK